MWTFVAAGGENATFNKSTDSYVAIPHPNPGFSPALVLGAPCQMAGFTELTSSI